jgi:hypothetical protein
MHTRRLKRPPGFYMVSCHNRIRDLLERRSQGEKVEVGICPRCGGPLTARVGKRGPYFHCFCHEVPYRGPVILTRPRRQPPVGGRLSAGG